MKIHTFAALLLLITFAVALNVETLVDNIFANDANEQYQARLKKLRDEGASQQCISCVQTCENPRKNIRCFVSCSVHCSKKQETLSDNPIALALASNTQISLDVNKLLDQIVSVANWRPTTFTQRDVAGGIWVTSVEDGKVLSAYWHPSRWHRASVNGKVEVKGDWVEPGKTAISIASSAFFGNKSYYDLK
jgi:hypothetical protein